VVAREHGNVHRSSSLSAAALVRLLERCDAFRRPERFAEALLACECDARGRLGYEDSAYPQRDHLLAALHAALTVNTESVAGQVMARTESGPVGERIARAIHSARAEAVALHLPAAADMSDSGV
jgi:tRNA nucleotidyltransferase (CCA-adding enzyme)